MTLLNLLRNRIIYYDNPVLLYDLVSGHQTLYATYIRRAMQYSETIVLTSIRESASLLEYVCCDLSL